MNTWNSLDEPHRYAVEQEKSNINAYTLYDPLKQNLKTGKANPLLLVKL